jgi:hypothetical protein
LSLFLQLKEAQKQADNLAIGVQLVTIAQSNLDGVQAVITSKLSKFGSEVTKLANESCRKLQELSEKSLHEKRDLLLDQDSQLKNAVLGLRRPMQQASTTQNKYGLAGQTGGCKQYAIISIFSLSRSSGFDCG